MDKQKKRGRPKKIGSKKEQYRLRMSEEEAELLSFLSGKTGKNKADIIRESLKMYNNLVKYSDN